MARISAFGFGTGALPAECNATGSGGPRVIAHSATGTGYGFTAGTTVGSVGILEVGSIASATNEVIVHMRVEVGPTPTAGRNLFGIGRPIAGDWLVFETVDGAGGTIRVGLYGGDALTNTVALTELDQFTGWTWSTSHDIWIKWKSDASTGVCEVRVDGATPTGWVDISTGDTQGASGTDLTRAVVTFLNSVSNDTGIGDIVVLDDSGGAYDDFLADQPTIYYRAADGVSAGVDDWTGSDADSVDNHLHVDDLVGAGSMTDYIESGTAADRQVFDVAASPTGVSIIGVTAVAQAKDADFGNQSVDIGVRSSASETKDTKILTESTFQYNSYVWQDPNTAADWADVAAVDAAQWVAEVN